MSVMLRLLTASDTASLMCLRKRFRKRWRLTALFCFPWLRRSMIRKAIVDHCDFRTLRYHSESNRTCLRV